MGGVCAAITTHLWHISSTALTQLWHIMWVWTSTASGRSAGWFVLPGLMAGEGGGRWGSGVHLGFRSAAGRRMACNHIAGSCVPSCRPTARFPTESRASEGGGGLLVRHSSVAGAALSSLPATGAMQYCPALHTPTSLRPPPFRSRFPWQVQRGVEASGRHAFSGAYLYLLRPPFTRCTALLYSNLHSSSASRVALVLQWLKSAHSIVLVKWTRAHAAYHAPMHCSLLRSTCV